jgi:exosortase F-associated protein
LNRQRSAYLCILAIAILASLYIFQRIDYWKYTLHLIGLSDFYSPEWAFVVNKTFRLLGNDFACFILIYAIFESTSYLRVAFYLLLIELLIVLPIYFILKLSLEGPTEISSPLLSQIHRIIVNPILMLLLMVGFWYQRRIRNLG